MIYGFSQELLNNEKVKNYIETGSFGYLHHTNRTVETDKRIEKNCSELSVPINYLATWLTSSDGRHFADLLNDFETEIERNDYIDRYTVTIHNLGLIYSDPTHRGLMSDTIRISKQRKEELW